jgi:hypothetical protein
MGTVDKMDTLDMMDGVAILNSSNQYLSPIDSPAGFGETPTHGNDKDSDCYGCIPGDRS